MKEVDTTTDFDPDGDLTPVFDFLQDTAGDCWKRKIRRAWRLHLLQEETMVQIQQLHSQMFKVLRAGGATFRPDIDGMIGDAGAFECSCGKTFASGQGLANHRRHAHGIYAPERRFVAGSICPHCLKDFWCSARLRQHLAYMPRSGQPNPCYAALEAIGYEVDYMSTSPFRNHYVDSIVAKQFRLLGRMDNGRLSTRSLSLIFEPN